MAVALAPALVFSLKHPVAFPCKRSWHCASAAQTADCFCSEAGCQLWQAHRKALRRHCAPRVWRWPCCCLALLGLGRLYWPVMCESGCVMDHPNASRRPLYSRSALRPKPNGVMDHPNACCIPVALCGRSPMAIRSTWFARERRSAQRTRPMHAAVCMPYLR